MKSRFHIDHPLARWGSAAALVLPLLLLSIAAWADARRLPVAVVTAERVYEVRIDGRTAADALAAAGLEADEDDIVLPPLATPLAAGDRVTLHRVDRTRVERTADVPFETVRIPAPYLRAGSEVVLAEGRVGRSRVALEIVRVDGKPYAESLLESEVLEEPSPRRVLKGTGKGLAAAAPRTLQATAYTPGPESCGPSADGVTATGRPAGYGVAAVDPSVVPLGTRLYVEGYGFAVAADVGSAIRGDRIDLCFDTVEAARAFGRRPVKVYFL